MADCNVNKANDPNTSPNIENLKIRVDELYNFRDRYIEINGLERVSSKEEDLKIKQTSILEFIDKNRNSLEKQNRCHFYLHLGRTLNVTSKYVSEAEEYLSKAIKLDPKLVEAWNYLGECYWKNNKVKDAKNCFVGALTHERNKVSLRNLSMTLRQLGNNHQEKLDNVEESVKIAKEAVKLDLTDGTSWLILGNAYLTSFFICGQNPSYLQNCMTAFNKAERDPVATGNPDLYYNKAVAYKYEEEYLKSLTTFERASALDPTWDEAIKKKDDLISYLSKVQDLIKQKGKVKAKKLENMLSSLSAANLGPYKDGGYTSPVGQTITLELVALNDLLTGANKNKVAVGRVVCSVYSENDVPFTFCMVDKQGSCFSVTVYNLAQGEGVIIGDSVAIPEPYVQPVQFNYSDKVFSFNSIRISNPLIMVINGKKCGRNKVASSKLSISLMSQ